MRWLVCLAAALLAAAPGGAQPPPERVERSTVRILNYRLQANWYSPWEALRPQSNTGSGFVIRDGLIMTNAHVVSGARMVLFYKNGDPDPHQAEVRFIGHDCDLAVLAPVDPQALADVPRLRLGSLPPIGSTVVTYGYPAGGRQISSTRGVVSRIDVTRYSHSGLDHHLAGQTDAAINPGNSGGPVLQDGAVVGVAFQAAPDLENVGFFIPPEVVRHFLEDAADGRYDGYPVLGTIFTTMESPAARRRAGLGESGSGVEIEFVFPGTSADGLLREQDIVLAVDGHDVANDSTIARDGLRIGLAAALDRAQVGEVQRFDVLREGRELRVDVELKPFPPFDRYTNLYEEVPRYYVYGGYVFVPLHRETMKTFGSDWIASADRHLLHEYFYRVYREPETILSERVVLLRRLDDPSNVDGAWSKNLVVESVNGRPVGSLGELVEAIESDGSPHLVFEFGYYDRFLVLDRAAAEAANAGILERYGVAQDRLL